MTAKRSLTLLVLVAISYYKGSWCDKIQMSTELPSKASHITQPETSWNQSSAVFDPAFYVTTDFILRLNELIKHLATYSLDNTLEPRDAIDLAGAMWNQTEASLEDIVTRSRSTTANRRNGNLTNLALRTALEAVQSEKSNFLRQMANYNHSKATPEIDAISLIDRTTQDGDVVMSDPDMTLIMHSSVHELTTVSMGLLHSLEGITVPNRQARANPTQSSVEKFLAVFKRAIVDTKLNFQTQANRVLRRVRAHLSALDGTRELGSYLKSYADLITMFKKDVNKLLYMTYRSVEMSLNPYRTRIDEELTMGISDQLTTAGMSNGHAYLYLCFKRYIFPYYDQSLAVAKLLHCGEPELKTMEYLVTVAIPILERAAISDSSAVQMNVICASGSTECMNNYYMSLSDQLYAAQERFQSYEHFIELELLALSHRVDVCAYSTVLDVENYVQVIKAKFQSCLNTGSVN
ncbi:uncharacterized protein LOC128711180 [Anopheles marshallii]|uniref:uncharacterized protein LOC128711180 n=1 Tax=Anopheles marshallii TaxID=1521116 RepID=UPI00237B3C87|nr:uncharacterized protein LOC128711180 [Anopheles marshallii]